MLSVMVILCPPTTKVFFCRFGLKVRLVRRKEKLTLLPYCLPLPVNSHLDAISTSLYIYITIYSIVAVFNKIVKMV